MRVLVPLISCLFGIMAVTGYSKDLTEYSFSIPGLLMGAVGHVTIEWQFGKPVVRDFGRAVGVHSSNAFRDLEGVAYDSNTHVLTLQIPGDGGIGTKEIRLNLKDKSVQDSRLPPRKMTEKQVTVDQLKTQLSRAKRSFREAWVSGEERPRILDYEGAPGTKTSMVEYSSVMPEGSSYRVVVEWNLDGDNPLVRDIELRDFQFGKPRTFSQIQSVEYEPIKKVFRIRGAKNPNGAPPGSWECELNLDRKLLMGQDYRVRLLSSQDYIDPTYHKTHSDDNLAWIPGQAHSLSVTLRGLPGPGCAALDEVATQKTRQ